MDDYGLPDYHADHEDGFMGKENPAGIPQIMENYRRVKAGQAVLNRVDCNRGY
jgi:hypothetical protein